MHIFLPCKKTRTRLRNSFSILATKLSTTNLSTNENLPQLFIVSIGRSYSSFKNLQSKNIVLKLKPIHKRTFIFNMVAEDEDKSKYRRVASDTPDSSCNEWKQIRDRATKIVIVRALSVLLIEIVQNCSFDP